jgi:hypothetical protein
MKSEILEIDLLRVKVTIELLVSSEWDLGSSKSPRLDSPDTLLFELLGAVGLLSSTASRDHPSLCRCLPFLLATMAVVDHFLQGSSSKSTRGLLRIIILLTIAAAAVSSRLFSVIREHSPQIPEYGANYVLQDSKASYMNVSPNTVSAAATSTSRLTIP